MMVTAIKDPHMMAGESCDYHSDPYYESTHCGDSPAGYIGDIYYACDEHVDEMVEWLES